MSEEKKLPENYKYSPFRNIGPQQPYETLHPNEKLREDCRKRYEGQIYQTKQGYQIQIIDYIDVHNVMVRFIHDGFIKRTSMSTIKKELVFYPYKPNKYGAVIGVGPYTESNSKKIHSIWFGMLGRCYDESYKIRRYRMYDNSTVCKEWFNFQNFAFWYDNYSSHLNPDPIFNYQIDKDILQQGIENKIYSPETCSIVPKIVNSAYECMNVIRLEGNQNLPKGVNRIIQSKGKIKYESRCSFGPGKNGVYLGIYDTPEEAFLVYKAAKEKYIKELADYYYNLNAISITVYNAMHSIDIKPFGE